MNTDQTFGSRSLPARNRSVLEKRKSDIPRNSRPLDDRARNLWVIISMEIGRTKYETADRCCVSVEEVEQIMFISPRSMALVPKSRLLTQLCSNQ